MYRAEFSKIIKEDIDNAHNYIKKTLEAPMAADKLKIEYGYALDEHSP